MAGALQKVAARMLAEREESRRMVSEREHAEREAAQAAAAKKSSTFEEFAAHCRIKTKGTVTEPPRVIMLDPKVWFEEQKRFNRERTGRDLVLKSRQIGFTTIEQMRGLFQSGTRSSWNTKIVGHDRDLVEKLFENIRFAGEHLTLEGRLPALNQDTLRALRFDGLGSSISVTEAGATKRSAEKKGHSETIHRLHCTEVSRWNEPETTLTGLIGAVTPGGEILIESTANGVGGWFHKTVMECRKGNGPYKLHFYPWFEHARYRTKPPKGFDKKPRNETEVLLRKLGCDDDQIAWWRAKVAELPSHEIALEQFPPTIDIAFQLSGAAYFPAEAIARNAAKVRDPIRKLPVVFKGRVLGELLIFAEPVRGRQYVGGGDVSEGVGRDAHSLTFVDRRTADTVATFWSDSIEAGDVGLAMAVIGLLYNTALLGPERNNNGHATVRALTTETDYPHDRIYCADDGRPGWVTNNVTRPILFDDLKRGLKDGAYWTPDADTHAELTTVIRGENGKPEARDKGKENGSKDDRVLSLGIALQLRLAPWPEVEVAAPDLDGLQQESEWGSPAGEHPDPRF